MHKRDNCVYSSFKDTASKWQGPGYSAVKLIWLVISKGTEDFRFASFCALRLALKYGRTQNILLLVIASSDVVAPKRAVCFVMEAIHLCTLSSDSAGQLNVLGHDGDALGVDGAQVGVFKQTNKVSLACFLKSHHSRALETQIGLEVLSDFSHKTLEGQLAD